MDRKIIFVGGIHGVGKTTFCQSIASSLRLQHVSASELIYTGKQIHSTTSKQVDDIGENQSILIAGIEKTIDRDRWWLIDGHFCLLNEQNVISNIPLPTFEAIAPKAILILYDDARKVTERLAERDQKKYVHELVVSLQERELEYGAHIAKSLHIPCVQGNPFIDQEMMKTFVQKVISGGLFK